MAFLYDLMTVVKVADFIMPTGIFCGVSVFVVAHVIEKEFYRTLDGHVEEKVKAKKLESGGGLAG
jgi:hypothetical protein